VPVWHQWELELPARDSIVYAAGDQPGKQSEETVTKRSPYSANWHCCPPPFWAKIWSASESRKAALVFRGGLVATHRYVRISVAVWIWSAHRDGMRRIRHGRFADHRL